MTDPLTALRDVPTLLTPERAARARAGTHERLDALIAPAPRQRRRGARRAGALALAAAAAAAALVLIPGGGSRGPATAAAALHQLGRRAAGQPPLQLGPGEYYAVRIRQRTPGAAVGADVDERTWAAPGTRGRDLSIVDGHTYSDGPLPPRPRAGASKIPDWSTFPTEPAALARTMRAAADALGHVRAAPTTRDYVRTAAFMVFGRDRVPPATLQAVYDFLAGLPGIRLVGDVTDPLGRAGTAVAVDGNVDSEGIGVELILDRTTGLPLAILHYHAGEVGGPYVYVTRQEGVVHGTDALPG